MSNNNWGGSRPNSGRPNGSKTMLTQMREQVAKDHPKFNPISWLLSVVQDEDVPINVRVQACNNACKYLYLPEAKPEEELIELPQIQISLVSPEDERTNPTIEG
ncbi:MAG TPA: hypothetical protein EYN38_06330 [Flavobacteriales bacterium]|nr:hypothetical protein [Flavobacteriales bacterium]